MTVDDRIANDGDSNNTESTIAHKWTNIEGIQITFARHCNQDFGHAHHVLNEAFSEPMEDIADLFDDDTRTSLNTTGEMNAVRRLKAMIISTIERAAVNTATTSRVSVLIDPLPMSYFRIIGKGVQKSFIRSPKNLEDFLNEANKQYLTTPEVRLNINSLFFKKGFIPEDFSDISDKAFPEEIPPQAAPAPQAPPAPDRVFIYLQIHHVNEINATAQTFKAKFYVKATWVQKNPTNVVVPAIWKKIDQTAWPNEVNVPKLRFDNAVEVMALEERELSISTWRKVNPFQIPDNNSVVMEWSAFGSGVFSHQFNFENFPCDIQLLKITISSGSQLLDDCTDNVRSTIRKDYIVNDGYEVDTGRLSSFSSDDRDGAKGATLISEVNEIEINPINTRRKFHTLSYLIPVKRINHHVKREILHPVMLITLTSMVSFIFPPNNPSGRFGVSITIALVMAGYSYVIVTYLPRTKEESRFASYIFWSFVFVFMVVIENCLVALIDCNGYCEVAADTETDTEDGNEAESVKRFLLIATRNFRDRSSLMEPGNLVIADFVFFALFMVIWLTMNGRIYIQVFSVMEKKEHKKIEGKLTELKQKRDNRLRLIECTAPFESRHNLTRIPSGETVEVSL